MRKYQHSACLFFISAIALCVPEIVHASIFSIQNLATKQISNESIHQAANTSNDYVKVANVCFITDSNDCRDNIFSANDLEKEPDGTTPPPTSPDDEVSQTPCEEAGYHKTACPEGWTAVNFCPYDTTYFKSCECHACDGYNYTADEIPAGYIKGASCDTCGETMYKIIPANCDGYSECAHGPAENALSCLSGNTVKYSNCCIPLPNETDCVYGTEEASDGCNSTRTICSECKPLPDEEGCENKHPCSDGCSGTRMCCDIDPCVDINCGTNAHCEDGQCLCDEGYEGNPTIACHQYEEDKCKDVTCGTNEHCEDGTCVCDDGYELVDGKCVAIDKCKDVTCGTNEHCEDGTCVCDDGYELVDGKCVAIDKCKDVTCGTNEHCEDGTCVCDDGYELVDGKCVAIDKCENVQCEYPQVCKDGKCICEVYIATQPCPKGQVCAEKGICGGCVKCIPDPDCATYSMNCPEGSECNATDKCGNCTSCGPVDLCANKTCGTNEHCENGICLCNEGYEMVNGQCVASDPCKNVTCGTHEYCKDGTCVCEGGYEEVDGQCVLIDQCKDVTCGTNEHCEYGRCVCDPGYNRDTEGKCIAHCVKKAECYDSSEPCEGNLTRITDGCGGYCSRCSSAECNRLGYQKNPTDSSCSEWEYCPYSTAYKKCKNKRTDSCEGVVCGANSYCSKGLCICNIGYTNKGKGCVKEDPCANVTCGSNEHCENGRCTCDEGYELSNGKCTEVIEDPCGNVNCGANSYCNNGTCVCDAGYKKDSNGNCKQICQKNPYCYNGICPGGTTIASDGCGGLCAICPSVTCSDLGYKTGISSSNCEEWTYCPYSTSYRNCTKAKQDRPMSGGHRQPSNINTDSNSSSSSSSSSGTNSNGNISSTISPLPGGIDTSLITKDSCSSVTCPVGVICLNGCAKYTIETKCCKSVCSSCKAISTSGNSSGGGGGGGIRFENSRFEIMSRY